MPRFWCGPFHPALDHSKHSPSRNWTCIGFLHLARDSYGANHHWLAKHVEYSRKAIEHGKPKKGMPQELAGHGRRVNVRALRSS
jgi:hypothetical protein